MIFENHNYESPKTILQFRNGLMLPEDTRNGKRRVSWEKPLIGVQVHPEVKNNAWIFSP